MRTSSRHAGLRAQLDQGILGSSWLAALATLALLVAWYATSLVYDLLNHGPYRLFLKTPLDDAIHVVPLFVIPYDSLVPFIAASMLAFLVFRIRVLRSASLAMIATWAVSYAIYFFLQSYVDRPHLVGGDLLTRMVGDVYASDQPYNDFPSLHTSLSTILAIHWWRVDRRIGLPVALWTALIVASTVFVKQHYVADVAGGLVLAFATSAVFRRWGPGKEAP